MREELKGLTRDLKKFLSAAEEEDLILKAAPKKQKAAFNIPAAKQAAVTDTDNNTEEEEVTVMPKTSRAKTKKEAAPAANTAVEISTQDKQAQLEALAAQITKCSRCPLGETRIKAVPGEGNINARLMFVGEGPGYEEDRQGRPFVGKAGQLLDKIIGAMGFSREEVFIANMVKCHPMVDPSDPEKRSNDRAPVPDEIAVCRKYIEQQIALIQPEYIVALGGVAAKSLIKDTPNLASIRGKIYDLQLNHAELKKPVKILATFHPAALLRNPGWKKDAWADLKVLLKDMGVTPPASSIPSKNAKED